MNDQLLNGGISDGGMELVRGGVELTGVIAGKCACSPCEGYVYGETSGNKCACNCSDSWTAQTLYSNTQNSAGGGSGLSPHPKPAK